MHIGKSNPKLDYNENGNENRILIETSEEKDLGVWITNDSDLKHEKQVIAASQRAMAVLRSVRRALILFDLT